jgi:hypothetical protein
MGKGISAEIHRERLGKADGVLPRNSQARRVVILCAGQAKSR